MNREEMYAEIVSRIEYVLRDRGGFDDWWREIGYPLRSEIRLEMEEEIREIVEEYLGKE